jgi:hypothetical protein
VSRVLPYCAFIANPRVELPQFGVDGREVKLLELGELSILWSEVNWPYDPQAMQRHAVEFHDVVRQVSLKAAVIPFRLLSAFENQASLSAFMSANDIYFVSDLKRLAGAVQMECVIYFVAGRPQATESGTAYLREKAGLLQRVRKSTDDVTRALVDLAQDLKVREVRNGARIFVLVERGAEQRFKAAVENVELPGVLSRRTSGPWPAAEFLSEQLRTPQASPVK